MAATKSGFRVQHSGHLYRWCSCDHACLKCACFASWLNLKHGLPHENIMQLYHVTGDSGSQSQMEYIYADLGKDKNTNDNDLLTYSISSQLYSKGGLFDFKMLTLDLNHIANNPLCNMSTKNRTDIRPFPFKRMQCRTSSSALITV